MFSKNVRTLAPLVALLVLLCGLSACGSNTSGQPAVQTSPTVTGNLPDSLRIDIEVPSVVQGKQPHLTLRNVAQVQQFYHTTLALPLMPQQIACTAEVGPHYKLTFLHGTRILTQALAMRQGCDPVTITGEKQDRRASPAYWTQLDQAIYAATPIAKPQSLAIQHTLQGNQPVQTARIADATIAQRLYNALLALPQTTQDDCNDSSYPEYQLVFQTADQAVPALISQKCNTIALNGAYQSRGGVYTLTAQFKQLFAQTLAGATFAPAQPDQLMFTLEELKGTSSHGPVTDAALKQRLYTKIFALPVGAVPPGCPSGADKVNGVGKWYHLDFTQGGLPVMSLTVYEGSCKLIQPSPGVNSDQTLQGDAGFWDLVHRAAKV